MTGQLGLLPPTANELRAEETDTAERSDDPTPRGVIRAVLWAALGQHALMRYFNGLTWALQGLAVGQVKKPLRVLDVCAGHGGWASEMRRRAQLQGWPVYITGVELHAPREPDLRKWCDEVVINDWRETVEIAGAMGEGWDIAIGNPHFEALTHDDPGESMPAVLLRHAPAVLLLHTQQAFLKSEAGRAAWRRCPPAASWLVPGSVKFRKGVNPKCPKCKHVNLDVATRCGGPGDPYAAPEVLLESVCGAKLKAWGADSRCYQVSLWLRGHTGPTATHLLPELTAAERQWVVAPGSEQPSADLPAAPGWTP